MEQRQHAVVIGSGMGGLAAAQVLSRHFSHVTVLEKDAEPRGAALTMSAAEVASLDTPLRPGVPQVCLTSRARPTQPAACVSQALLSRPLLALT
jgi:glycine/D-amino acid oxidase-like deaminating enzyme